MAWGTRGGRQRYFYKAVRVGNRIRHVYLGRGDKAEAQARMIEEHRAALASRREHREQEVSDVIQAEKSAQMLKAWIEALAKAELISNGMYNHHGQWRRRRNASSGHG